jgi:TPR repeat protein
MARFGLADTDGATPARLNANNADAEGLFELGMMYASGRSVPADLVSAHQWFNLAAQKGHADAARMRREIAAEMTDSEIGQAQRAARDWLKTHAVTAPAPQLRAAA